MWFNHLLLLWQSKLAEKHGFFSVLAWQGNSFASSLGWGLQRWDRTRGVCVSSSGNIPGQAKGWSLLTDQQKAVK